MTNPSFILGSEPITDSGMRGFLTWARQEYPAEIYAKIAAGVQQRFPQAFSGYLGGGWRKLAKLSGLSDGTTPTVDTADAANSTPNSPTWTDQISELIGTVTGAVLNIQQQQTQQAIVQTQLQAAQNGQKLLPISLSQNGITFGNAGLTGGGALVALGLGFLALKAFGVIK